MFEQFITFTLLVDSSVVIYLKNVPNTSLYIERYSKSNIRFLFYKKLWALSNGHIDYTVFLVNSITRSFYSTMHMHRRTNLLCRIFSKTADPNNFIFILELSIENKVAWSFLLCLLCHFWDRSCQNVNYKKIHWYMDTFSGLLPHIYF